MELLKKGEVIYFTRYDSSVTKERSKFIISRRVFHGCRETLFPAHIAVPHGAAAGRN